jgi:pyridinium-3,5-bisthiocarboxylic acid mononucleotide nickel chelatase
MKRVMFIECSSGIAGDMLLGALIDAGLPTDLLTKALGSLGVGHELRVSRVVRAGISATKVDVLEKPEPKPRQRSTGAHHAHGPDGERHTHPQAGAAHRSIAEITHLIEHANLSKSARAKALSLFERLAQVEAAVHNMPVDQVHLHEVGAVDSIVDIVGCVFGLEWFGVEQVVVSPLNLGSGSVNISHGRYPVPAPATLQLVAGLPVYADGPAVELTTPTGALLAGGYADAFGAMPAMVISNVGYGAGTKDFADRPNVVRVAVGTAATREAALPPSGEANAVVKIECEIDDMSPQLFGPVLEMLLAVGALDAYLTSVLMKKQRPGVLLTVIAPPAKRELLTSVIFDHTTTIGVRYSLFERDILARRSVPVETPFGQIRMKIATREGEVVNAAPEFDDCLRAATTHAVPVKVVQAQAMRAWLGGASNGPISERRTEPRPSPRRANQRRPAGPRGRTGPRGKR